MSLTYRLRNKKLRETIRRLTAERDEAENRAVKAEQLLRQAMTDNDSLRKLLRQTTD